MIIKRISFITIFITAHLIFVVAQIHKHSTITELIYQKQKNEKRLHELLEKKQTLVHTLHQQQNRTLIKDFATKNLHMSSIKLNQIKRLESKQ